MRRAPAILFMGLVVGIGSIGQAAGPSAAQVLALKPVQPGVQYDTPSPDSWSRCKLEVVKQPTSGWVVRDPQGTIVRMFLDTNGNNVVDRWCYFHGGQQVYCDIDSNGNGKADQYHWYHNAGTRLGEDPNEDGQIDRWRAISAEESTAEALAAMASRDFERIRKVLVNEDDIRALGLDGPAAERARRSIAEASRKFNAQCAQSPGGLEWVQFSGHRPLAVPGNTVAQQDLILYQHATIAAQAGAQQRWYRVPEVVKVGETWKLTDVPVPLEEQGIEAAGVLLGPPAEPTPAPALSGGGGEVPAAARQFLQMLEAHDARHQAANLADPALAAQFHVKRAELCAHIGSKCQEIRQREHWYQQAAEGINAAVQTGQYPDGIRLLESYAQQFAKTTWGKSLAAHFEFRAINATYLASLEAPDADHQKVQETHLARLQQFIQTHPDWEDSADALWQLGNGLEFAGEAEKAGANYRQLIERYPSQAIAERARGAIRRIEGEGKPFELAGRSLLGSDRIDLASYRGKVLVVHYWATWSDPSVKEMARFKAIRAKYGAQGLEVIGICLDSDRTAGAAHVRQHGYDWPQIHEDGALDSAPAVRFGVISLPHVLVVGSEGRIADPSLQFPELDAAIEKQMAQEVANRKR